MYKEWSSVLANSVLFKNMGMESINILLNCLQPKVHCFEKGEYITLEGDTFHGLGIILDGSVNIIKETFEGNRIMINTMDSGDIFGEIVAFSDISTWPVTVVANTQTSVVFLPPDKITGHCPKMCVNHMKLTGNMLNLLSNRGIYLKKRLELLTIKSIREKISTYLLDHHLKTGTTQFNIPMNRSELAEFLNVTRPSLSREMCNMRDDGIINFKKSQIEINNLKELKNIVN